MGWQIQNIIANLVIIFGPNKGTGLFLYNGSPSHGNLIASLTTATQDDFGNTTVPNGLAVYGAGGAVAFLGISGTEDILQFFSGASQEKSPAQILTQFLGTSPAQFIASVFNGPQISLAGHQDLVSLQLDSPAVDGSSFANGRLNYTDTNGVLNLQAFWDATGFNIVKGPVPNVQTDVTQRNSTTSTITQITPSYTIPANTMAVGSSWELELFLAGNQNATTATTLEFLFQVNGNNTAITVPAGFATANGAFRGSAKLKLACKIPGPANTAAIFLNGEVQLTQTSFAIANSNKFEVSSPNAQGPNASVDTTVAQAVAISTAWGTSGSLGGLYTRFTRLS